MLFQIRPDDSVPDYVRKIADRAWKRDNARGLDGGGTPRNKPLAPVVFNVAGNLPAGAAVNDQAWFFAQLGDLPKDTTYAIATMTPVASRFTNAQVADWFSYQPTYCAAANVVAVSSAAVMSSMTLLPVRFDPYGSIAQDSQYQISYQNANQFQTTRGQFPVDDIIDGYTYFQLTNVASNPAATYQISWFFGPRYDRRTAVPRGVPVTINAPGGQS